MISIRKLNLGDMRQAMELKALCWPEELSGLSDTRLNVEEEYNFWTHWMSQEKENNDVRLLYGAFDNDEMLGVAFGSFIESKDAPDMGIELNGLWVYPGHRGRGVSVIILNKLLSDFYELGARKMVVYNFHHSSSNSFYRRLGFEAIGMKYQMKEKLPVDIFACDIDILQNNTEAKLSKYK